MAVVGAAEFGVCAKLVTGASPSAMAKTKPITLAAHRRRLKRDLLAPKARSVPVVRVTSEAAKANHRQGLKPAHGVSRAAAAR